jgi:release factor glutamine methyltransferase
MTRWQALVRARELLTRHQIEDAHLEAELLLRYTLKIDRTQLFTDPDFVLTKQQEETYRQYVEQRIQGEPSAYITNHREFFGLDFYVDTNVLIPRPETELLVEQTIAYTGSHSNPLIIDVGTGCGNIAISLAFHLPEAIVYAIDISEAALKVARRNCLNHHVADKVKLLAGDMLEPLPMLFDFIVANLPYIPTNEVSQVNTSGFEPSLALDGGPDGTDAIKSLCVQIKNRLRPGGCFLLEIGMGQSKIIIDFLHRLYPSAEIKVVLDLNNIERVIRMIMPTT